MRTLLLVPLIAFTMAGQPGYPPPFPRKDAGKLLDNDRVEVWDVYWPKGQPTAMHEHPYDQISITLTPGTIRVVRPDGKASTGHSVFGSASFVRKGTVHSEEGMADVPQHKIMVELKPSVSHPVLATGRAPEAFPREGAVKLLEADGAIVWDFTWKPGQIVPRHVDGHDTVVVFLEGGGVRSVSDHGETTEMTKKTGDVVYLPAGTDPHTDKAVNGSPRAIIVELK